MASHSVYLGVAVCSSISKMFSQNRISMIFLFFVMCVYDSGTAPAVAKARQFLPPMPGYVPVYIRPGNTPLEDINLDLAEAFSSYARKHARITFGRSHNDLTITDDEKKEDDQNLQSVELSDNKDDITIVQLDEELNGDTKTSQKPYESQHIQKIPRSI